MTRRMTIRHSRAVTYAVALLLLFQGVLGAQGIVICQHPDDSAHLEGLSERDACHQPQEEETGPNSDVLLTSGCTDQPLASLASLLSTRTDAQRLARSMMLVAILPWDTALQQSSLLSLPSTHPASFSPPAATQHALRLSAVVLQV